MRTAWKSAFCCSILAVAIVLATAGCSTSRESSSATTAGAASLVSIAVTPSSTSIAFGTSEQFAATGTYTDGSTRVLTASATWTSSAQAIATISSSGNAISLAAGSTTISAEFESVTGSATLTVTAAPVVSIAITPAQPLVAPNESQQFTATGTFADGSTQDLTKTATWNSSNPAVATIAATGATGGFAQTVAEGTTGISATASGVSGTTLLTVSSATITAIQVTPSPLTIAKGTKGQLSAIATYNDDSTRDVSSLVAWSSSSGAVASVNDSGLVAGLQTGSSTITATAAGGVAGSANVQVTSATLVSIALDPPAASIPLGTTQQFRALGTFSDASTQDLTDTAQWTSSSAPVATVSMAPATAGVASTVGAGETTITATLDTISGTANLTVTSSALQSIAVTPANASIVLGQSQQFNATGTYADQSTKNITNDVTWSSSNSIVAVTSNQTSSHGVATSSGPGAATITARMSTVSGSAAIAVTALAAPGGLTATASADQIALAWQAVTGATSYQVSRGTVSGGPYSILNTVSGPSYVDAGLPAATTYYYVVRAINTITLSGFSTQASATTPANEPTLVSIGISPSDPSIVAGETQQLTATAYYSDSSTTDVTDTATWSSSDTAVATIGSTGLSSALTPGSSTIGAAYGGKSASTMLTVTAAGECLTFSPVDVFLTMNGSAAGTRVTAGNLTAGTEGASNYLGWSQASSAETFAFSKVAMPAAVSVRSGTTHGCGFATQSLAHNGQTDFSTSRMDFGGGAQNVTTSGWIVNLPPNQGRGGNYYDLVLNVGFRVPYTATLQLDSGVNDPACPSYCMEIESSGGATIHSMGNTAVSPGGTYFFSMNTNWSSSGSCASEPVSGASWASGYATISMGSNVINTGSTVTISGASPAGYNGTFRVASATGTTVTYSLKSNPGSYTSGGAATLPAPCTQAKLYTTSGSSFTQSGPAMAVSMDGPDALGGIYLGNNEGGTFDGTYYLQNIMVDYTNHAWPNIPH